jgi:uncharacterized phage protein (TIGR01671 family)
MREILFRGKSIADNMDGSPHEKGEWVFGNLIKEDNMIVGEFAEVHEDYAHLEWWCPVDPSTIGQYTGLKDKNGTKIFEGDIVTDNGDGKYLIKWINGCMCLSNMCSGIVASYTTISHLKTDARVEVVGNIHDKEIVE